MALFGLVPDPPAGGVQLRLSAEDAKREAIGRALIMVGSTVGIVGSGLVLMNNPIVRQKSQGFWAKLPPVVQNNKPYVLVGAGLAGAALIAYLVRTGAVKYWET